MPIYTDKLPQMVERTKVITLREVINILPEKLQYPMNVWVGDHLARYGKTGKTIIFLVNQKDAPNRDVKMYFSSLIQPLGLQATVSEIWKDNTIVALKLYNEGRLIISKKTLRYTEVPSAITELPILTFQEVLDKLPKTIPYPYTIYFTGGIVRYGHSYGDADFIIFSKDGVKVAIEWLKENSPNDSITINALSAHITTAQDVPNRTMTEIKRYLQDILKWHVDVGNHVMPEREPVYLYKIYENGKICLP